MPYSTEHVVSFPPNHMPHEDRFRIELTGITYPNRKYRIVRPNSPFFCLEYVIAGEGHVRCGDVEFIPRAGDAYLLPATLDHEYWASPRDPFKKIWMNVSGVLCDALFHTYMPAGHPHIPQCVDVLPLFEEFVDCCERNRNDPLFLADRCPIILHRIFIALSNASPAPQPRADAIAVRTRRYIDLHTQDALQSTSIAHAIGVSVSQMNRCFVREYDRTPYRYYTEQRLRQIQTLLAGTGLRSAEIARQMHFADEHYFSTWFKQHTGLTPKQYRLRRISGWQIPEAVA